MIEDVYDLLFFILTYKSSLEQLVLYVLLVVIIASMDIFHYNIFIMMLNIILDIKSITLVIENHDSTFRNSLT